MKIRDKPKRKKKKGGQGNRRTPAASVVCKMCDNTFWTTRSHARLCSPKCRQRFARFMKAERKTVTHTKRKPK